MNDHTYLHLALVAVLLLYGVFSSRLSSRLNMPVLLLFLGAGMVLGRHVDMDFSIAADPSVKFANVIGTVAMAFILYSGGLETNFRSIRKILVPGILLSTLGVFLTAGILALGVHFILGWSPEWSLLLGSVVASTDAAAVFAILRSKGVGLQGNLASVLELESGSNDPMAALMTIFMVSLLKSPDTTSLWSLAWLFPVKMLVGVICGFGIGKGGCWLFNKAKLDYEGLYFVLGIALVLFAYGVTEILYGNGFMAAYCTGLTMGNSRYNYKKSQIRINNGLAWLMQVAMFTVLGMLVNLSDLIAVPADGWYKSVWLRGLLLAMVLMFVARPAAVFLCLIKSQFSIRERLLVSWVGLRGAAPIVLATFPLAAHLSGNGSESAGTLFNLVFCMVIASVLIQGRTLMPFARKLQLDSPLSGRERMPLELEDTGALSHVTHEFDIFCDSPCLNKTLAELKLPGGAWVMLIRRNNSFVMPRGDTQIQLNDSLMVMADSHVMSKIAEEYFPGNDYYQE